MAFDSLSSRLQMGLRRVTGKGKLNENDIDDMLREVRLSLLEADVNYKVVKKFLANIKEQALGEKILKGLNPGQQVVKIVREELKRTLGDEAVELNIKQHGTTVVMAVGLQGAGKTTAVGKMALFYRKKLKKKPMLIAADIYRPAAVDQLVTLGKSIDIPVFEMGTKVKAEKIVEEGLKAAKEAGCNFVIIDTAGRLQINEELMQELQKEVTILIVTHNMGQAMRISSKSMFMYLGELVEYGDTAAMFSNPADERTKAYLTGKMG